MDRQRRIEVFLPAAHRLAVTRRFPDQRFDFGTRAPRTLARGAWHMTREKLEHIIQAAAAVIKAALT
jgi:hypothetical protein